MDIGQRIRFVRLFRGMKQEELAEKIGLGGGENRRTRTLPGCTRCCAAGQSKLHILRLAKSPKRIMTSGVTTIRSLILLRNVRRLCPRA